MAEGRITRWTQGRDAITAHIKTQVLEPEPTCANWSALVSQRSIRAMSISPRSRHIWMATWGGVLSWRQSEEFLYRRYSSEHGLAGNLINCICVDEDDRPWTGHDEGGLSYFDGHEWHVYGFLQADPVRALADAGSMSGIWAATSDSLWHIAAQDKRPDLFIKGHKAALKVNALISDGDDLLVGNNSGLYRCRKGSSPSPVEEHSLKACVALARDGGGRIWIATLDELYCLDHGTLSGHFINGKMTGRVIALTASNKRVWVLTTDGLVQVDDGVCSSIRAAQHDGLTATVRAIAASSTDNYLWIGTDYLPSGLYYPQPSEPIWDNSLLPPHPEDELSNLGRCAVARMDGSEVLIGTAAGIVSWRRDETFSVDRSEGDVRAMFLSSSDVDNQGRETLWMLRWPDGIGRLDHLGRFNPLKDELPGLPILFGPGRDGQPYAITGSGLWRLYGGLAQIASPLPSTPVCMAQGGDGTWWVGTISGVYHLTSTGWLLSNERHGPLLSEVYALEIIGNTLWAATESGLWARRADQWSLHIPSEPHFVFALAQSYSREGLWLAGKNGVAHYDLTTCVLSEPYTRIQHGLLSHRVTAIVESDNLLFIVTKAGVCRVKL